MCWDLESLQDLSKYFHCNCFADKDLRYFIYREDPFLNSQTGYRNVFNCEYDRFWDEDLSTLLQLQDWKDHQTVVREGRQ